MNVQGMSRMFMVLALLLYLGNVIPFCVAYAQWRSLVPFTFALNGDQA